MQSQEFPVSYRSSCLAYFFISDRFVLLFAILFCLAPVDTINAQQKLSQAQLGASQGGVNLYTGALGYNLPYKRKERLFGVFLPSLFCFSALPAAENGRK
jgi:hypothetical protein